MISAMGSSSIFDGTEGYALYVKNVGSSLAAASGWLNLAATGVISTSFQTILSSSGPLGANNTADIALDAATSGATAAGSYGDTITIISTSRY